MTASAAADLNAPLCKGVMPHGHGPARNFSARSAQRRLPPVNSGSRSARLVPIHLSRALRWPSRRQSAIAAGVLAVNWTVTPRSSTHSNGLVHCHPMRARAIAAEAKGPVAFLQAALTSLVHSAPVPRALLRVASASGRKHGLALSYHDRRSVSPAFLMRACSGLTLAAHTIRERWAAGASSAAAVGSPLSNRVVVRDLFLAHGLKTVAAIRRILLISTSVKPCTAAP